MTTFELKELIELEARKRNISTATFCKYSVGSSRLHKTLSGGGSCTLKVMERVLAYIASNPPIQDEDAA